MIDSTAKSGLASQRSTVMRAIENASQKTGANFDYLVKTAQRESNFDPSAKARTSSATGLFQFTDSTWLRMVDRYGEQHGLNVEANAISVSGRKINVEGGVSRNDILALRSDPDLSSRMAAELANENSTILNARIGREPTGAELYVAHFLGPSDAAKLINAARDGGTQSAVEMFPAAAKANPTIFKTKAGGDLTVDQLYAELTKNIAPSSGAYLPSVSSNTTALHAVYRSEQPASSSFVPSGDVAQLASGLMQALFEMQAEVLSNDEKTDEDDAKPRTPFDGGQSDA